MKTDAELMNEFFETNHYEPTVDWRDPKFAALAKADVSDEARDDHGKWTTGAQSGAYKQKKDDYTGKYPVDDKGVGLGYDSPEGIAFRQRESDWKASTKMALTEGDTTEAEAKTKGFYSDGGGKYGELPSTLYHVTTSADAIQTEGIKTRDEHGTNAGIGGGTSDTISLTSDLKTAEDYHAGVLEAHDLMNGKITVAGMMQDARDGALTNGKDFSDKVTDMYAREGKELDGMPQGLYDAINGTKTWYVGKYALAPENEGRREMLLQMSGNGEANQGTKIVNGEFLQRPATGEEQLRQKAEFLQRYQFMRESAGGPAAPAFFTNDWEAFKAKPATDIRLMQFDTKPGSQGYYLPGEHEWRVHSGHVLRLNSVLKIARDTLNKYSPDQQRDARGRFGSGGASSDETVTVFHGTAAAYVDDVIKNGLLPVKSSRVALGENRRDKTLYRGIRGESVYVTPHEDDALKYATATASAYREKLPPEQRLSNPEPEYLFGDKNYPVASKTPWVETAILHFEVPKSVADKFKIDEHDNINSTIRDAKGRLVPRGGFRIESGSLSAKYLKGYDLITKDQYGEDIHSKKYISLSKVDGGETTTVYAVVLFSQKSADDVKKYSPDQPREPDGKFGEGDGGSEKTVVYRLGWAGEKQDAEKGTGSFAGDAARVASHINYTEESDKASGDTIFAYEVPKVTEWIKQRQGNTIMLTDKAKLIGSVPLSDVYEKAKAGMFDVTGTHIESLFSDHAVKKYSPDQPRDDHGRFGSGGGVMAVGTEIDPNARNPFVDEEKARGVEIVAKDMAKKLGYKGEIEVTRGQDHQFQLNGKTYLAAGTANLQNGKITLYPTQLGDGSQVEGVLAHEIGHIQYQTVLSAQDKEWGGIQNHGNVTVDRGEDSAPRFKEMPALTNEGVMRDHPLLNEKFPTSAAIAKYDTSAMRQKLHDEDGMSDYSKSWWKAYDDKTASWTQAMHETYAEITKQVYDNKSSGQTRWYASSNVKPLWRKYYADVTAEYNRIKKS